MRGDAEALHHREIVPNAAVEVLEVTRAAMVLGSTQSFDVVDRDQAERLGMDVVRRRSGGGAVLLQPDDHVWIDVTVPRGHRLWNDDVERATWWLGDVWCAALRVIDPIAEWKVHREKLLASGPERVVCFASVGPGEVVRRGQRDNDGEKVVGEKVVGISQRRTRDAARFQCTVFRRIDVALYRSLLRAPVPEGLSRATGVGNRLGDLRARVEIDLVRALEIDL